MLFDSLFSDLLFKVLVLHLILHQEVILLAIGVGLDLDLQCLYLLGGLV